MKVDMGINAISMTARVKNRLACHSHQAEWKKYKLDHSCSSLLGVKRMLWRLEERNASEPLCKTVQPHDDDEDVIIPQHNYSGATRF